MDAVSARSAKKKIDPHNRSSERRQGATRGVDRIAAGQGANMLPEVLGDEESRAGRFGIPTRLHSPES
jgi:hypothetical protein